MTELSPTKLLGTRGTRRLADAESMGAPAGLHRRNRDAAKAILPRPIAYLRKIKRNSNLQYENADLACRDHPMSPNGDLPLGRLDQRKTSLH